MVLFVWNQDGFLGNKLTNYLLQRRQHAVVCNRSACKETMCLHGRMALKLWEVGCLFRYRWIFPTNFYLREGSVQWWTAPSGSWLFNSDQVIFSPWELKTKRCWVFWISFGLVSCWSLWCFLWEAENPQEPLREPSFSSTTECLTLMPPAAQNTLCWDILHLPSLWLELSSSWATHVK